MPQRISVIALVMAGVAISGCATVQKAPAKSQVWMFERPQNAGRCNDDILPFDPVRIAEDETYQGRSEVILPSRREAVRLARYAYSVEGRLTRRPLDGEVRCLTVVRMENSSGPALAAFGFTLRATDDATVEVRARSLKIESAALWRQARPVVGLNAAFAIAPAPDFGRPGPTPPEQWTRTVIDFGSVPVGNGRVDADGTFLAPWAIGQEPMSLSATFTERAN